jgi:multiple sugar transport system substrate-binding protein
MLTDDSRKTMPWRLAGKYRPMTAYAWMLAFGGGVLEEGNYRFLAPNNVETFKFLRELSESNCAWQGAVKIRSPRLRTARRCSSPPFGRPSFRGARFANAGNATNGRVIPFPNEDDGVLAVYGSSYVVLKSTDEEQLAAWLFVRWLLENEQDARWVEATHLFPLRTSTLDLLGDYEKTHPQWKQAVDLDSAGRVATSTGSWRTVKIMLGDGFGTCTASMFRADRWPRSLHKWIDGEEI